MSEYFGRAEVSLLPINQLPPWPDPLTRSFRQSIRRGGFCARIIQSLSPTVVCLFVIRVQSRTLPLEELSCPNRCRDCSKRNRRLRHIEAVRKDCGLLSVDYI
jgi:hypothetical protein